MLDPHDEGTLDMFRGTDLFPDTRTCEFSPCRNYRYSLRVEWEPGAFVLPVIMLNPSTADETANDPTVERVQRRAMKLKYGGIQVLNLFAYRATEPKDMKAQHDPVGPDNDATIRRVLEGVAHAVRAVDGDPRDFPVLLGWGTHGSFKGRDAEVLELVRQSGVHPVHLGITKDGHPKHPLYVGYNVGFSTFPLTDADA